MVIGLTSPQKYLCKQRSFILATGLKYINDLFKFCTPLKTKDDITTLKGFLNNLWTNVAMMDYPYPTTFLMPLPGNPVEAVCNQIVNNIQDEDLHKQNKKAIVNAIYKGKQRPKNM